MKQTFITIAASLLLSTSAWAGALTVPNTFTAGTPAVAADVNANFTAAKTAVDDNDARITAITSCTNPNNPNDVMVKVGPLCVDKYEASIWSAANGTGTTYGVFAGQTAYPASFPANGNWTTAPLYAASKVGVLPSTNVTWFQAQQACFASGKRLLSNAEWQAVAAGTPDPGLGGDGVTTCNTNTAAAVVTGNAAACVSKWGVMDMVGNVMELVGDWVQGNANPWAPSITTTNATYGSDSMLGTNPAQFQGGSTNMPAALGRGGSWSRSTSAGVFDLNATAGPAFANGTLGFRCAR